MSRKNKRPARFLGWIDGPFVIERHEGNTSIPVSPLKQGAFVAKRFTDTAKWDKTWFRKLSPKMKCVWGFFVDRCDHAGVWDLDIDTLNHFVGEDTSLHEIITTFGDKIEVFDSKILINPFIEFQYGTLNPSNKVHNSVLKRLAAIDKKKVLPSPLEGSKDKDTDKDKDKDKDKDRHDDMRKEKPVNHVANFESRFTNPDFPKFQEALEKLGPLVEISWSKRIPQLVDHFGTYERFKVWVVAVWNSKGYEKCPDEETKQRYLSKTIQNEVTV